MRTSGVAGSWHVGPSMRPTDVGTRLEAHGFEGGLEPGMAAHLRALTDVEAPTDVRISRVVTDTGLDAYEQVLSLGFGEGPPEAAWVREMYGRIGVGNDVPWLPYVGLADSDPVACASVFLAAGVAGLYFVCTVPDARRRGIGAAISREALAATLELGFDVGVLGSSPMGQPMYERLGFRGGMRGEPLRVVAVNAANHGARYQPTPGVRSRAEHPAPPLLWEQEAGGSIRSSRLRFVRATEG